uniref:uncharacterized protein LOC100428594 n=1 Tax=Macaca mulatta TaxID=9544 RepID=UPI0010A25549|nr:uncharacterized protein LOC100428594 [Macaca mulatta]
MWLSTFQGIHIPFHRGSMCPTGSYFLPFKPDSRKAEGGLLQNIYLCQFLIQGPGAGASVLPVLALGSRNALNPHFSQGLRPTYLGLSPGASGWTERGCALEHRAGEEGEKPSWRLRGEGRAFPSGLALAILTLREGVSPTAPRPPLRLPPPHRAAPRRAQVPAQCPRLRGAQATLVQSRGAPRALQKHQWPPGGHGPAAAPTLATLDCSPHSQPHPPTPSTPYFAASKDTNHLLAEVAWTEPRRRFWQLHTPSQGGEGARRSVGSAAPCRPG